MKLYNHQTECIAAIETQFIAGVKHTLAVLATGSGKTMIYLHLVDQWVKQGKRVLILAHRRELIHQPVDRAKEFYPELAKKMGIVMAKDDESQTQVTVATIQTANRQRLVGHFDYVILDECHHGTAAMYLKLFEEYKDAQWLGLTATPFRTDGKSLSRIFDSVAYRFPITAAIEEGILVPFDAFGFTVPITVEGVTETADGWDEKVIGGLLSARNVLEVVYEKWEEHCKDRITFCFTSSVAQAYATAKYFRARGVQAQAVDGSTPKTKRDLILRLFKAGRVRVLCNCQVFTEGVDVPQASAALMVCPTKSDLAYVQKLGRILRTTLGKENAIVLDFAPLDDRNIVMAGDILGNSYVTKKAMARAKRSGVLSRVSRVDKQGVSTEVDPDELVIEVLKYLRQSMLAWTLQDHIAVASVSENSMLAIELPNLNRLQAAEKAKREGKWGYKEENLHKFLKEYKLWHCHKLNYTWTAELEGVFLDMEAAYAKGDLIVTHGFLPGLAKKQRAWRGKPISVGQQMYMQRLNILVPENCTQGQAAQLISHELAYRAIEKSRRHVEILVMNKSKEK